MKKYLLFLLIGLTFFSYASADKIVYRIVENNANGQFDWTCVDAYDHFIIYCEASTVCKTCPLSVNATNCGDGGVFDNTDYSAMEALFTHADAQIVSGVNSGTEIQVFQVIGESSPRTYKVTWEFNSNTNSHEQKWEKL